MIGAIGALIAGAVIWRLWPAGVLFLLLWPVLLVALSLPSLGTTMAKFGYQVEVTPVVIGLYYLQTVVIIGVFFFIAFGIQKWVTRDRTSNDEPTEDA